MGLAAARPWAFGETNSTAENRGLRIGRGDAFEHKCVLFGMIAVLDIFEKSVLRLLPWRKH